MLRCQHLSRHVRGQRRVRWLLHVRAAVGQPIHLHGSGLSRTRTLMTSVPDLLYLEPQRRLDARALREALTFAFATGGTSESFTKIWERANFGASDFSSDCFAGELFLNDFVTRCLSFSIAVRNTCPSAATCSV